MAEHWSVNAGYDQRIIFKFIDNEGEEAFMLHDLGSRDEVY